MQNDVGLCGCNPALPPGLTLKKFSVLPTQCIYVFYMDQSCYMAEKRGLLEQVTPEE